MYKNKKVLVAGGTGTIGMPLVKKLVEREAKINNHDLVIRLKGR